MGQRIEEKKRRTYGKKLEIRGVGKKVFGDICLAMLFGVSISGAGTEIGKAVFFLDLRGKLRNTRHDRYKKITGCKKITVCILSMGVCQSKVSKADLGILLSIAQKLTTAQYGKTTGNALFHFYFKTKAAPAKHVVLK